MNNFKFFGNFVRERRLALDLTLRDFSRITGNDVGNLSRLERGLLGPPQKPKEQERLARALGLKPGSDDWQTFFDLAASCAGRIPQRIMNDAELVAKLPLVFRTISGKKLTAKQLEKLAAALRKENSTEED